MLPSRFKISLCVLALAVVHVCRIDSVPCFRNEGSTLVSADRISLYVYWCFLVLLCKRYECRSVVVKKCGMVYTVMEEERYHNITDSVGGLMYPFPLSLEQSWLIFSKDCVVVQMPFHRHLKPIVYWVKSASWLCWKVVIGKKEFAGMKDCVGRGETNTWSFLLNKSFPCVYCYLWKLLNLDFCLLIALFGQIWTA